MERIREELDPELDDSKSVKDAGSEKVRVLCVKLPSTETSETISEEEGEG